MGRPRKRWRDQFHLRTKEQETRPILREHDDDDDDDDIDKCVIYILSCTNLVL